MTTTGTPAAATGLPNDAARLQQAREIISNMENDIYVVTHLLFAANLAVKQYRNNESGAFCDALSAVLDCAEERQERVMSGWIKAFDVTYKGAIHD